MAKNPGAISWLLMIVRRLFSILMVFWSNRWILKLRHLRIYSNSFRKTSRILSDSIWPTAECRDSKSLKRFTATSFICHLQKKRWRNLGLNSQNLFMIRLSDVLLSGERGNFLAGIMENIISLSY